jgi:hypothetical protein
LYSPEKSRSFTNQKLLQQDEEFLHEGGVEMVKIPSNPLQHEVDYDFKRLVSQKELMHKSVFTILGKVVKNVSFGGINFTAERVEVHTAQLQYA